MKTYIIFLASTSSVLPYLHLHMSSILPQPLSYIQSVFSNSLSHSCQTHAAMASQKRSPTKDAHQQTRFKGTSHKNSSKTPLAKPGGSRVHKMTGGSSYCTPKRKGRPFRYQRAGLNCASERFGELQDREHAALPYMSHSQPSREILEADQQSGPG